AARDKAWHESKRQASQAAFRRRRGGASLQCGATVDRWAIADARAVAGEADMERSGMRVKTWQDAWGWAAAGGGASNRRELEAIMGRYAEDVALSSPAVVGRMGRADGWLHGKAEVRAYFTIGLRAPGLHFELLDVLFGVNAICMIFRRETGAT